MNEDTISENNTSAEFEEGEALEQTEGIYEDTKSGDSSSWELRGEESLKQSDGVNEEVMPKDSGSREFVKSEEGWEGDQEKSGESFDRPYRIYTSVNSSSEKISEHASAIPLKKTWTNDMQLVSMYFDEKHKGIIRKKNYLASQPELESLLADYIETILIVQPDDVIGFTAQHFKAFAVQIN